MTEAQHLHQDLLHAWHRLVPRSIYQDSRRLDTLAWAITGLCLTQKVHLFAWAEVVQSRAQTLASRIQRFSTFLHHPAIVPLDWYRPVMCSVLSDWPAHQRLYVALDTTALPPFVIIYASLVYRGRALPLAWRTLEHRWAMVAFEDYQPVLEQVARMGLSEVVVLADRGFAHERLLHYLRQRRWHFRLRLKGSTLVHLPANWVGAVKMLCPPAGATRFIQQAALFGSGFGPVSLALATPLQHEVAPWFVASSEPSTPATLTEYGLRFDVEESFKDDKSGGFQRKPSRLTTPDALDRLLLCLALATVYLTSLGASIVQAKQWRQVDHHWGRGLSYLQLGTRWQRQQGQRGWQAFAPFRLDPAPDPLPALIPRRTSLGESQKPDLPMAA